MTWSESLDRAPQLKLTVVVIAYNMERELPRTLKSLSSTMQNSVDTDDSVSYTHLTLPTICSV